MRPEGEKYGLVHKRVRLAHPDVVSRQYQVYAVKDWPGIQMGSGPGKDARLCVLYSYRKNIARPNINVYARHVYT